MNKIRLALSASMMMCIMASCTKEDLDVEQPLSARSAEEKSASTSPIQTTPATIFSNLFNTFGGGWTGGDGAYSIPLPDGRVLWTFGDSFLGTVQPDFSRPGTPMINNSFVIQDGNQLTTLAGGTPNQPQAYVKPTDNPNHWYWPGDGRVIGNKLYMFMLRIRNTGQGGVWSFEHIGTDMAVFSLPDITLIDQYEVVRTKDYLFGVHTLEEDDFIYIYGTRRVFGLQAVVARMHKSDPATIEHWNGSDWTPNFAGNAYMMRSNGQALGVSNMFSVFKYKGKYRLLTQEDFLGSKIYLYSGDTPTGPWRSQVLVYETPETGGNLFTYNAYAHPHINHSTNGMLVTYNVNSQNFWDLFGDARIYRPRFFWLKESDLD